jgi:hypothetical protein
MNRLTINFESAKEVAEILYEKFNSDEGIFGHNVRSADLLPSGIRRGPYEHLMFYTLVISIDYQRNSAQLWNAAKKTFEDEGTRWLFIPKELLNKSFNEIKSAMKVHRLAKKPNQDAKIWYTVSKSFFEIYDSDPMNLIKECEYDAWKLFNKKFDLGFKRRFPFLSGNKIFPLWIRLLHDYVGIDFKNLDKIPIPIDTHVVRATFTTGCLTGRYIGTISDIAPKIDEAWKKVLELVNHRELKYRLQLDGPLLHLSRFGCKFRAGNSCPDAKKNVCPVKNYCVGGIVHVSSSRRIEVDTYVCTP